MTDLTVVVAVHDGTTACGPTLRAVDRAVAVARAEGHDVEPVLLLADPPAAARAHVEQPRYDHWVRVDRAGPVATAVTGLAAECSGRHVAVLGVDDLVSENWFAAALRMLDTTRGERVVARPELDVTFDGRVSVQATVDQESPLYTPHLLALDAGPTTWVAPRTAYAGLGDDPRAWLVRSVAAGWRHRVVRDTLCFHRCRAWAPPGAGAPRGSTGERPLAPVLDGLAIDRVEGLGRPSR
jgi:hypothetical protein